MLKWLDGKATRLPLPLLACHQSRFCPGLLLHVSRPVRWDGDHVVILDDELQAITKEVVRSGKLAEKIHFGLDYFDASINRVAAWVIGTRNLLKALLIASLEPLDRFSK